MRKVWSIDELRKLTPEASDEDLAAAMESLNRRKRSLVESWKADVTFGMSANEVGPDGFTKPERELNAWAAEHGLPIPFPKPMGKG